MRYLLILLMVCLCCAGTVFGQGATYNWTSDSLGRTIGSAYNYDTIQITGTATTTGTLGVKLEGCTGAVLRGTRGRHADSLIFGTAAADTFSTYIGVDILNCTRVTVKDLVVAFLPDSGCSASPSNYFAGKNNITVYTHGTVGKTIFLNLRIITNGWNCTGHRNEGLADSIVLRGCKITNDGCGYTNRHDYLSTATKTVGDQTRYAYPNIIYVKDTITQSPDKGMTVTNGVFLFDSCHITMDTFNDGIPEQHANEYAIILASGTKGGTMVRDCIIRSGTNHSGGMGILAEECKGTADSLIIIKGCDIRIHQGHDGENTSPSTGGIARAIRFRNGVNATTGGYVHACSNYVEVTVDSNSTTDAYGNWGFGFDFYSWPGYDLGHNWVYDNEFHIIALDSGTFACGIQYGSRQDDDNGNRFFNNKVYSSNYPMALTNRFGNDLPCRNMLFAGNTIGFEIVADSFVNVPKKTWTIGVNNGTNDSCNANVGLNNLFVNGAAVNDVEWYDSASIGPSDIRHKITLTLQVLDSLDAPLADAACSVWNAYNQLVLSGTSDVNGQVSDTITLIANYKENVNDSAMATFTTKAWKDALSDENTGLTFTSALTGDVDTLQIATEGETDLSQLNEITDTTSTSVTVRTTFYNVSGSLTAVLLYLDQDNPPTTLRQSDVSAPENPYLWDAVEGLTGGETYFLMTIAADEVTSDTSAVTSVTLPTEEEPPVIYRRLRGVK